MHEIMACNTTQAQNKLVSEYGTRVSVLAYLKYFDTIRRNIVDPIHNLFLGSAKHLLKVFEENMYLFKSNLEKIQKKNR